LHPENVSRAVLQVRPYAVDVSSGVEFQPGSKDSARINAFIQAVRQADNQAG
jgi:phosphoribosylanthranilate isomerase